jgi:hypothetical protein
MLAESRRGDRREGSRDGAKGEAVRRRQDLVDGLRLQGRERRRKRGKLCPQPSRQLQPFCVGFRQETMNGPDVSAMGQPGAERDTGYTAVPLDQEQVLQQGLRDEASSCGGSQDHPTEVCLVQSRGKAESHCRDRCRALENPDPDKQPITGDDPQYDKSRIESCRKRLSEVQGVLAKIGAAPPVHAYNGRPGEAVLTAAVIQDDERRHLGVLDDYRAACCRRLTTSGVGWPSAGRPTCFWNSRTAERVLGPKSPSVSSA